MLRCDCDEAADPADLLTGRTAPESSDRLVLTPDTVVVVVVAGPDDGGADAPRCPDDDPPLLDLRLNQPRQLMSAAQAVAAAAESSAKAGGFRVESPAQAAPPAAAALSGDRSEQRTRAVPCRLSGDRRLRAYASL
jgi:hypothetical protein